MGRIEGYYWCKLNKNWDIFYFCENLDDDMQSGYWYDGMQNSYKEKDFDEIDERRITRE